MELTKKFFMISAAEIRVQTFPSSYDCKKKKTRSITRTQNISKYTSRLVLDGTYFLKHPYHLKVFDSQYLLEDFCQVKILILTILIRAAYFLKICDKLKTGTVYFFASSKPGLFIFYCGMTKRCGNQHFWISKIWNHFPLFLLKSLGFSKILLSNKAAQNTGI